MVQQRDFNQEVSAGVGVPVRLKGKTGISFRNFPRIERENTTKKSLSIAGKPEIDFALAVSVKPKLMEKIKPIYLDNVIKVQQLIRKYRKKNPDIENVFYISTVKTDLNTHMGLGVALLFFETGREGELLSMIRSGFAQMIKVSSSEDPFYAEEYTLNKIFQKKTGTFKNGITNLIGHLCAIVFLGKMGDEEYILGESNLEAYALTTHPQLTLENTEKDMKQNKQAIKEMRKILEIDWIGNQGNKRYPFTQLVLTNSEGKTNTGDIESSLGKLLQMSYVFNYGNFADVVGLDSHIIQSYELSVKEIDLIVYSVLSNLDIMKQELSYTNSDYFLMFVSMTTMYIIIQLNKQAKDAILAESGVDTAKQIAIAKKEAEKDKKNLENELEKARKEVGRLEMLLESASKKAEHDRLEIKKLKGAIDENRVLRRENSILDKTVAQLSEMLTQATPEASKEEMVEYLNSKKLLLVGGHQNFHSKLTVELPNLKVVHLDYNNTKTMKNPSQNDAIFIFSDHLNHGLSYRLENEVTDSRKLIYLNSHVNLDLVVQEMYSAVKGLES